MQGEDSFKAYNNRETAGEKFWRKFKMEPFIPIGTRSFRRRTKRARIDLVVDITRKKITHTQTKINHKTGCVATVGILCAGLANFRKGGSASMSQRMMRMRVIAQGFTVAAFVAGAGAQSLFADDHVEENRRR